MVKISWGKYSAGTHSQLGSHEDTWAVTSLDLPGEQSEEAARAALEWILSANNFAPVFSSLARRSHLLAFCRNV